MTAMTDPATKQDLKDAVLEFKLYVAERESNWLKWVVGFQLSYFAIVVAAMFFITEHIK